MSRLGLIRLSAGTLAAAIALGAVGAHVMKDMFITGGEDQWRTGSFYLSLTALGLGVIAGWASEMVNERTASRAGVVAWVGSLLFAGTLYGLALGGPRWLGAVTPIGGASMIGAWIAVLVHVGRTGSGPTNQSAPRPKSGRGAGQGDPR